MKERLSVYLDPAVMAQLSAYAARRNKSLSLVAEAALASFLSPDGPDKLEAAFYRRSSCSGPMARANWSTTACARTTTSSTGQITGQVTENVYDSPTGRTLPIPQCAKLIGM